MILEISNLSKSFEGKIVLSDINLKINKGECYCLIGKNGAGKSTLINNLCNLVPVDSGTIKFFGKLYSESPLEIKKKLGVLPEINPVVEEFSGPEYLEYVGYLYDLKKQNIDKRIEVLVNYFFEDANLIDKPIVNFSKGMKLKLGICAAVIHKPKLVLLDEPFNGLDVLSSNKLVSFLNYYKKEGNAILLSSHNMLYSQKVATDIGILKATNLIFSSTMKELLNGNSMSFEEKVSELLGSIMKEFSSFE